jgi:hypothetical protein
LNFETSRETTMAQQINCLKCKSSIDAEYDLCPHCEKITLFQKTYASRLLDGKYQIIDRLGVGGWARSSRSATSTSTSSA